MIRWRVARTRYPYTAMRVVDALRASELFEQLSSDELQLLARELRQVELGHGDVLYRQGDAANEMFVIVEGCVQAMSTGPDGRLRMVGQASDGETLGEMALFSGDTHPNTACAITDARVLVLRKEAFERVVEGRPHIMRNVLAAVSRRAARATRRVAAQAINDPHGGTTGRIYAVFSPRGGSGKTTVAINLAARLAREQPDRVALVDLDLLFGDAALLLDVDKPPTLAALPDADLERLDLRTLATATVQHDSGIRVLVGAAKPEEGERITPAHIQAALGGLRRQFLVTVVDCGNSAWKPLVACLEAADRVVLVCTPELSTLRDVRDCQRMLSQVLQGDKNKTLYVMNHPTGVAGLSRERFERALEHTLAGELPYAGDAAAKAAFAGGSYVQAVGKTPLSRAVDDLIGKLQPPAAARDGRYAAGATGQANGARPGLLRLLRPAALLSRDGR